jgi:hypothetical protein
MHSFVLTKDLFSLWNNIEPHNCKPQTIPRGPNRKISPCQAQVGTRIPGRTRFLRCLHEPPTRQNGGIY